MSDYLSRMADAIALADAESRMKTSALAKYLDAVPKPNPPPHGLFGLSRPINPQLSDVLVPTGDRPAAPAVPKSLLVTWSRLPGRWLHLYEAVKRAPRRKGVYIIWRGGDGRVIRLGQGDVADRLDTHWWDDKILVAACGEPLLATWTTVHPHLCSGVERYLAEHYKPLVGQRFPDCVSIRVNPPN